MLPSSFVLLQVLLQFVSSRCALILFIYPQRMINMIKLLHVIVVGRTKAQLPDATDSYFHEHELCVFQNTSQHFFTSSRNLLDCVSF